MRLWSVGRARGLEQTTLGKVTSRPIEPTSERGDYIPFGSSHDLATFGGDWRGYAAVLCTTPEESLNPAPQHAIFGAPNLDYLADADVVALGVDGGVRVWYRRNSATNAILLTEQCNSFCLMCSQPPKDRDDSHRVPLILRLIELIDPSAGVVTLTGGEPTLLGDSFFSIVGKTKESLPHTGVHVLTNGRRFADPALAQQLAGLQHPDLVLGIPLYSDLDWEHDHVVQSRGAYDETIAGFYNLAQTGVRLELRVVLHQQTVGRLPDLARFVTRNLPFVEHVALMGLEMYGFTPQNLDVLWIDPVDYAAQLSRAVRVLALSGMNVSIYNHQLCTLPRDVWPFARKSISDWKNVYLSQCESCEVKSYCGGFFQSGTKRHSRAIRALPPLTEHMRDAMNAFARY